MPTYVYKCAHCQDQIEEQRKVAEREMLVPCPKCREGYYTPQIALTAPPKFNGTGFYATDYKKPKK
jgi:putative FmdB family regulatory protein